MVTGNSNNRRNKKGSGWGIAVVVAAVLISSLAEKLEDFRYSFRGLPRLDSFDLSRLEFLLVPLAVVLFTAAVAIAVYKAAKIRKAESASAESYQSVRRAPTKQDRSGFDAANSGYSHDRARRQAQLDSFLKNGIIDKAEYLVLMDRYKKEESQF